MNKSLTQEVFKYAPEWVKSASVDIEGDLHFHGCKADDLIISHICGWFLSSSQHKSSMVDKGYDAELWEESPIDRE